MALRDKFVRLNYFIRPRVRVNGHCSEIFKLKRGTRQGEAPSPVLFTLSIEPLVGAFRQDPQIHSIKNEGQM